MYDSHPSFFHLSLPCPPYLALQDYTFACSFAEGLDKGAYGGAVGYAKETARCKALDVAKRLMEKGRAPNLIIGADTARSTS
jgi:predicted house-cleaning NTP pyrophosphatase (Maf/HAM1 superfamily)